MFPLMTQGDGEMMTSQITMEQTPLNSLDRCDRCGAQAYVRAILYQVVNYYLFTPRKSYAEGFKTSGRSNSR